MQHVYVDRRLRRRYVADNKAYLTSMLDSRQSTDQNTPGQKDKPEDQRTNAQLCHAARANVGGASTHYSDLDKQAGQYAASVQQAMPCVVLASTAAVLLMSEGCRSIMP